MPVQLVKLRGNEIFNWTVWPPQIYVLDDMIIYRKRKWFSVQEITMLYNQISQVNMVKGIIFGHLSISTTGTHDAEARFVNKRGAIRAKKIIDDKVYWAHHKKGRGDQEQKSNHNKITGYEKSLKRLNELLQKGKIGKMEFRKRKRELLKKV